MNNNDNKALLLEAIDNYDLLTPNERKILKTLVKIAVDDIAVINIKRLSEISKVSRPIIYKAMSTYNQHGLLERAESTRSSLNSFVLKKNSLKNIIKHYVAQKNI